MLAQWPVDAEALVVEIGLVMSDLSQGNGVSDGLLLGVIRRGAIWRCATA
jgi:hypothetical protein